MNSNNNNNKSKNRITQSHGVYNAHPRGGFVAWPDGRTTRTGACRTSHAVAPGEHEDREGFVAWPEPGTVNNDVKFKRTSMKQTMQAALGAHKNNGEVNKGRAYNLLFAGRITLKEYLKEAGEKRKQRLHTQ